MKAYQLSVPHVGNIAKASCSFLFLFWTFTLFAQVASHTVSGEVTNSKKVPLSGVSVMLKGSATGTTTNANGHYSLANVPDNGVLVFSFTGFASQEIPVSSKSTVDIALSESVSSLNEIVVIGYGTQTKKDLTGAVSQVKATQLENENPKTVQGRTKAMSTAANGRRWEKSPRILLSKGRINSQTRSDPDAHETGS